MQKTLDQLGQSPGIEGSLIISEDGMIVLANVSGEFDAETVGAMASAIINSANKAGARLGQGAMRSLVLEAEGGKLFFFPTQVGYLVVIGSPTANLGLVRLEMKNAAQILDAMDLTAVSSAAV